MVLYISRLRIDHRGNHRFELVSDLKPFDYNGDTVRFNGPVRIKGEVQMHQDYYLVTGEVYAEVILRCSRCLGEFLHRIQTTFQQKYAEAGDEEDVFLLKGDRLDLTEPVLESILLELPIKGLCRQDCKGICPVCGIDKNLDECNCIQEDIDPRLVELKKLLEE